MPIYISGTYGETIISGSHEASLRNSTYPSSQEQVARVEWGPDQFAVGTHYLGFSLPRNSIITRLYTDIGPGFFKTDEPTECLLHAYFSSSYGFHTYLISGSGGSADSSLAVLTSSLTSSYPGQTDAVQNLANAASDSPLSWLPSRIALEPAESYPLMCSVGGYPLTAGTASFIISYISGSAVI